MLPRNWTGKSGGICGLVYWTCNNLEEKIWKSFHSETEIKKYDICTFWEISDTTPQYLSGLFPLRFLFWSGNQIEKFQTCWKSNFKKKLSTLNEAFPGKKVHIYQFLLTKICWRHGGIISGSFEACLNNFLSIPVCEALQFSPSSARIYAHSFDPGSKMERCDSKD